MKLTKEDIEFIDQQPLTKVLELEQYQPVSEGAHEALYLCPFHSDHHASLHVQLQAELNPEARQSYPVMAWHCFPCSAGGFGAISLYSKLTGYTDSTEYYNVARLLAQNLNLELPSKTAVNDAFANRTKNVVPVKEMTYEYADWTPLNLRALGCITTPITTIEMVDIGGEMIEQKVSVLNEDGSVKCKSSWDQRAADGTYIPLDTKQLTELFGIRPVESFITPAVKRQEANGEESEISYRYEYVKGYPIFDIHYEDEKGWFSKRYEPYFRPYVRKDGKQISNFKFTWWFQGNKKRDRELKYNLYGDKDVMRALQNMDEVPSTSCPLHPVSTITVKNEKDEEETIVKFSRIIICSGPRDAINVWYHSNAHVVYPHSEGVEIQPRQIANLRKIAHEIYVLYDSDKTGTDQANQLCLRYLDLRLIKLPKELGLIKSPRSKKPCKDVSEYFHYFDSLKNKFENPTDYRNMHVNQHFERLIGSSKTMRFVQGEPHFRAKTHELFFKYQLDIASMLQFLHARGMMRASDELSYDFVIVRDNIVDGLSAKDAIVKAREMMITFMEARPEYTQDMCNAISTSNRLTVEILMSLPTMTLDMKSWGERWRYLFFRNTAVYIEAGKPTRMIPYSQLPIGVFRLAIKPYDYKPLKDLGYSRMQNPQYMLNKVDHESRLRGLTTVDRMKENKQWNEWCSVHRFLLQINKPLNEMPEAFQFIYDTCRLFDYKEKANIKLSEEEKQIVIAHFIAKMLCFGYMMSPYRTSSQQQLVICMDYFRQHKDANNGRSGKSLNILMLEHVLNIVVVKGREFKIGNDNMGKNFKDFIPYIHTLVAINDLMTKFDFGLLFNSVENISKKNLYKDEVTLPYDISPKLFITQNNKINDKDPSTLGRVRMMYAGDYYHQGSISGELETVSPLTKFGHNIMENPTEAELEYIKQTDEERFNRIQRERCWIHNFLIDCLQFYYEFQDVFLPPVLGDNIELINELDPIFAEWADKFFGMEEHFGVWIPVQEMLFSYLTYHGNPVGKGKPMSDNMLNRINDNSRLFRTSLETYCNLHHIVNTPKQLIGSKSDQEKGYRRAKHWVTQFDKFGRPEYPHTLIESKNPNGTDRSIPCRIFYRPEDEIPENYTLTPAIPREAPEADWLMIEAD